MSYTGAGTIEGLLQDGEYFFLEMNTRVQVEHCVTEMVTGIDIVKEGIRVAAGEPLSISQDDVVLRGHAIECRINAEDASKNFAPAPGSIGAYREPSGPGVRVDSGVGPGSEISPMYDPMVAKLIVWDVDREQATARMLRALSEYEIDGLKTLLPFHDAILRTPQWAAARDLPRPDRGPRVAQAACVPQAGRARARIRERREGRAGVHGRGLRQALRRPRDRAPRPGPLNGVAPAAARTARQARRPFAPQAAAEAATRSHSPIQGTVLKIAVEPGAASPRARSICVIEAMKMENEITAHKAGTVSELPIAVGASVATGDTLAVISDAAD